MPKLKSDTEDNFEEVDSIPEPQPEDAMNYGEEVNSLIRARYSLSEELAILRQRDDNPEEYQAYYDYCEECKTEVKQKMNL